jgi:uncharacterized protein YkwD
MNGMTPTCRRTGRRRVASIALSALALSGLTAVTAPQHADAVTASSRYEGDVAKYTNAERTKRGLVKLKWNGCLDRYAEAQAVRMAKRHSLQHQALLPILKNCHMNLVGENIAMGYPSGKAATAAWMHSPGHRANILKPSYRLLGHGAYRDSHGTWWVSHVFGRKA